MPKLKSSDSVEDDGVGSSRSNKEQGVGKMPRKEPKQKKVAIEKKREQKELKKQKK